MPWVAGDAHKFKKGLTDKQAETWAAIANSALERCREERGKDCDKGAIMRANGAVKEASMDEMQEAITIKAQAKQLLRQAKALLANKSLPDAIRVALDDVEGALKKTWADLEAEIEPEEEPEPAKVEPEQKPAKAAQAEALILDLVGDVLSLREGAVGKDGSVTVKVIRPGWGSSGYYPADILARDGAKVFTKGVKMFWDHATTKEEAERPEGTLDRLAGEFITDARWTDAGADGPGLYADAKVFSRYSGLINELAPHIGVSIRAMGRANEGEADGRKGPIIAELTAAKSVDFVTMPGAGGKVLQLFEAARKLQETINVTEQEAKELREANVTLSAEVTRLQEALLSREAQAFVTETLAGMQMPEPTRKRLQESWSRSAFLFDKNGVLDAKGYQAAIEEAAKVELAYIASVTPSDRGQIRGMGETPQPKTTDSLYESFRAIWIKNGKELAEAEKLARIAATGR